MKRRNRRQRRERAGALYLALLAQSRRLEFYGNLGVPDTVDGRFDMIALHMFMVLRRLADKIVNLRIFANEAGKFDKSLLDVQGEALVVSQFTLYGDLKKGRRPDFTGAAAPDKAKPLYEKFVEIFKGIGVRVKTGEFAAHMAVDSVNDGPVTLWMDTSTL